MTKVSVITANFNYAEFIVEYLNSVLAQTLEDIEVIIIDDKSTDDSVQIIQKFAEKDSRIKIICNETNLGAGASRNKGLDMARGEYIFFLDSDDTIDRDVLEVMYKTANEHGAKIVCGKVRKYKSEETIPEEISGNIAVKKVSIEDMGFEGNGFDDFGISGFFHRALFNDLRFPALHWEDIATMPAVKALSGMCLIDKWTYNYRLHADSTYFTSVNYKTPYIIEAVSVIDNLKKILNGKYTKEMDSMECLFMINRMGDVALWKDCGDDYKKAIINLLMRIIEIDVPNCRDNKHILEALPSGNSNYFDTGASHLLEDKKYACKRFRDHSPEEKKVIFARYIDSQYANTYNRKEVIECLRQIVQSPDFLGATIPKNAATESCIFLEPSSKHKKSIHF